MAFKEKFREATESGRAKILELESEAERLVKKVVEKGRDAQAEGKKRFEEIKQPLMERVREADLARRVRQLRTEVEERLEGGMERLLETFGIASKEDLEKLGKRVESLTSQVRELAKARKAQVAARLKRRGPSKK